MSSPLGRSELSLCWGTPEIACLGPLRELHLKGPSAPIRMTAEKFAASLTGAGSHGMWKVIDDVLRYD